jgi:hypothetical protein
VSSDEQERRARGDGGGRGENFVIVGLKRTRFAILTLAPHFIDTDGLEVRGWGRKAGERASGVAAAAGGDVVGSEERRRAGGGIGERRQAVRKKLRRRRRN